MLVVIFVDRKERKLFEEYQRATRALPDRKDRGEMDVLKAEVERLKEESVKRETRWGANTTRLRDRIEALEAENADLKDQVHVMEKRRLEVWQGKPSCVCIYLERLFNVLENRIKCLIIYNSALNVNV